MSQSCQKQFTMTPQSNSCASNVAAIDWFTQVNGVASGGSGTFAASAGQFTADEVKLWAHITNNTGAPYSIQITSHWTGVAPNGYANMYIFQPDFGTVVASVTHLSEATFNDTLSPTIVIPIGTSDFGLYIQIGTADVPDTTSCSGTLTVACV